MANGKDESECITCAFHLAVHADVMCQKHRFVVPTELGPYLICVDYKHQQRGSTVDYFRQRYSMQSGVLYQYNIYSADAPTSVGGFAEFRQLPE